MIFFISCCALVHINAQGDSASYYYFDKLMKLRICQDKIGVLMESKTDKRSLDLLCDTLQFRESLEYGSHGLYVILENINDFSIGQNQINNIKSKAYVKSVSNIYEDKGLFVGMTNRIIVCLKENIPVNEMERLLQIYQCTISDTCPFISRQYVLTINKGDSVSVMEKANLLFESGMFEFAEPDFISLNGFQSSDPYYSEQWGLENTGQNGGSSGIDINVENAWTITQGNPNIKIAVIDQGVELTHPDLIPNIVLGYSASDSLCGAPTLHTGNHGTACAGIIAAKSNNGIGTSGVAPNCKIIPTNVSDISEHVTTGLIAQTINWAWHHGADVISFAWRGPETASITRAIDSATVLGRDGKGCVVVCASGNNNSSSVNYPACLDNVIAVGAIDRCGYRAGRTNAVPITCDAWTDPDMPGSAYGSALDLVAPGSSVLTTDRLDSTGYNPSIYYSNHPDLDYTFFDGTSAACPHVAGVAALMLSANPNLARLIVKKFMEQSANKIRSNIYYYSNSPNHPNGSWNEQMGYGLVDAYAAVKKAIKTDLYVRDVYSDNGSEPSSAAYMWESPDIWIEDFSGNVVLNPEGNTLYRVCVKIHNKTVIPSSGNERLLLNWVKAGVGTRWPIDWTGSAFYNCIGDHVSKGGFVGDTAGVQIPSVPGHGNVIVRVPWITPNPQDYLYCSEFDGDTWHFCLLARVHDGNEIVGENTDGYGMVLLAQQNNNVAWKNISFLEGSTNSSVISVSNPTKNNQKRFTIRYKAVPNSVGEYINDFAEVSIQPTNMLVQRWMSCGHMGFNYHVDTLFLYPLIPQTSIIFIDTVAEMANIPIRYTDNFTMRVCVNFLANTQPKNDTMSFEIILVDERGDIMGGERYTAIRTQGRSFRAVAHDSQCVLIGEEVSLYAEDVGEPASYYWYDEKGLKKSVQENLDIQPQHSQKIILKVVVDEDGYTDYDTVFLNVTAGEIVQVFPNPAIYHVDVEYRLADIETINRIQLLDVRGNIIENCLISDTHGCISFDISQYLPGQYSVILVSLTGEILDVKSIIIR